MVAEAIASELQVLSAAVDHKLIKGAAFRVPLKGFGEQDFTICELRRIDQATSLALDELEKELLLTWPNVMAGLKELLEQINMRDSGPSAWSESAGRGRSWGGL